MTGPDWYAVLGVGHAASNAQIARAFRRLAFRWHPDRNLSQPELAHQQFLLVHQAYEVLHDPARRRAWDAEHAKPAPLAAEAAVPRDGRQRRAAPAGPPPRPPPPLPRRLVSRLAWLVLGSAIRLVGFAAMLLVGPIAERPAREEFRSRVPAFARVVFPIGRTLLLAGIVLLIAQVSWARSANPRFAIVLVAIGLVVFVIERIALATVWAFGRGRRPGT